MLWVTASRYRQACVPLSPSDSIDGVSIDNTGKCLSYQFNLKTTTKLIKYAKRTTLWTNNVGIADDETELKPAVVRSVPMACLN